MSLTSKRATAQDVEIVRGWYARLEAPQPADLHHSLMLVLQAADIGTAECEHGISGPLCPECPEGVRVSREVWQLGHALGTAKTQTEAFIQDASHRARSFLVSCVENKDLPMAERQNAAALLLRTP